MAITLFILFSFIIVSSIIIDIVLEKYFVPTSPTVIIDFDAEIYIRQLQIFLLVMPIALPLLLADIFIYDAGMPTNLGAISAFLLALSLGSLGLSVINGFRPSKIGEIEDYLEQRDTLGEQL